MSGKIEAEMRIRTELLLSRQRLLSGELDERLLDTLRERFPGEYEKALIVDHLPEQTEELFTVLVSSDRVAVVEVPRVHGEPTNVSEYSLDEYTMEVRRMTKPERRLFDVALRLRQEEN